MLYNMVILFVLYIHILIQQTMLISNKQLNDQLLINEL